MPFREGNVPVEEVALRMAAMRPIVLIVDSMEDGRIIREQATEADFGPAMRRMNVYAMSEGTYRRARDECFNLFAVEPDWDVRRDPTSGKGVVLPMMFPDGMREWRVDV
jgi:hypothetical protein